jgi:hypothetical protein
MRELRGGFAIAQRQALTKEAKAECLALISSAERLFTGTGFIASFL